MAQALKPLLKLQNIVGRRGVGVSPFDCSSILVTPVKHCGHGKLDRVLTAEKSRLAWRTIYLDVVQPSGGMPAGGAIFD